VARLVTSPYTTAKEEYPTLARFARVGTSDPWVLVYFTIGVEVCAAHPFAKTAKEWGTHFVFCADDLNGRATPPICAKWWEHGPQVSESVKGWDL
jgi:hypothetical protein